MTIVAALLVAFLIGMPSIAVVFSLGLSFWPAVGFGWVVFLVAFLLFLLVACGADLVGTVRRSR